MKENTTLAFLGGGNMARALIQGLLRHGLSPSQLRVGDPSEAQRARLHAELGVSAVADNRLAVRGASMVVLAVKPAEALSVLSDLCPDLAASRPLLLSIVAGLRIAQIGSVCPGLAIVRAMPNRAALVAAGATALYAGSEVEHGARALAECACAAVGLAVWVRRESDLDIVTALSGSGPAYFFQLTEHLAAAATALGLDRQTAAALAIQALRGAGAMLGETGDPAAQREAVTSPGGTTAAALAALAAGGFDKLVAAALAAAAARGAELGGMSGGLGMTVQE